MAKNYIIADSGATKCQWTMVSSNKKTTFATVGISPYFLSAAQIPVLGVEKNIFKMDSVFEKEAVLTVLFHLAGEFIHPYRERLNS